MKLINLYEAKAHPDPEFKKWFVSFKKLLQFDAIKIKPHPTLSALVVPDTCDNMSIYSDERTLPGVLLKYPLINVSGGRVTGLKFAGFTFPTMPHDVVKQLPLPKSNGTFRLATQTDSLAGLFDNTTMNNLHLQIQRTKISSQHGCSII